jgi:hypothetical protein
MPIDELVLQAMARWPSVPAMYGWLRLTRRGRWMLIDRGIAGFDETLHGGGSEITSPPIIDFIGRNYLCDEQGRWYWQNGPQRVFLDLDLAPLIYRVLGEAPQQSLITHTGYPVSVIHDARCDAEGNLWLTTEHGPGCIDDRDLGALQFEPNESADRSQPVGMMSLLGDHAVRPLAEAPDHAFGFVVKPRY